MLTWHLVLVYILMLLYMYITLGQGQVLCPYLSSFEMISSKSDFIHIFNDFIHVYSPGARAYNPLETNFWCQQKALITLPIRFKKIALKSDFIYLFFMFLHLYIAPGRGRQSTGDKILDDNRKAFSLCPYVASFKMITLKSDFIHF